jgi:hypothetical protein
LLLGWLVCTIHCTLGLPPFFFICFLWTTQVLEKKTAFPKLCSAAAQEKDCLKIVPRRIRALMPGGVFGRRPFEHCAPHVPSALHWGQWEDYRLLCSEVTMPLALLVVGQHIPGKTIGEEQEKGYSVRHKFHSVCSHLPFPGGENKGQKKT